MMLGLDIQKRLRLSRNRFVRVATIDKIYCKINEIIYPINRLYSNTLTCYYQPINLVFTQIEKIDKLINHQSYLGEY